MKYATATTTHYGRSYLCRVLPDLASANRHMQDNPEWSVLKEWSGRVYLARTSDEGVKA